MATAFLAKNAALAPLFLAVGAGVGGALAFGGYYLTKSPDVVIDKSKKPQPWNLVEQHKNTKLWSPNSQFWSSRTSLPDPRAAFLDSNSTTTTTTAAGKDAKSAASAPASRALALAEQREKAKKEAGVA